MASWIQKGDLSAAGFTNNNSAGSGGVGINVAVGSTVYNAIQAALAAVPGDKFLQGLGGYNAATNTLTLNMSDGSTVAVDLTGLLNDAVATITTGKVAFNDNSGALVGYLLPV